MSTPQIETLTLEETKDVKPKRKPRQRKIKSTVETEGVDISQDSPQEVLSLTASKGKGKSKKSNSVVLEKKAAVENVLDSQVQKYEPNPDYLLEVRMDNGITFKGIIESLKNVLPEANFMFNEAGLRMMAFEWQRCGGEITAVRGASMLTMAPAYFDIFHCKDEQIVGLDLPHFYKLIKPLKMNDSLSFVIHKDERDVLRIIMVNSEKMTRTEHRIHTKNLMDQIYESDNKLEFGFDYAPPVIDSANLQLVCRSLHSIEATNIIISYDNETLRFEGKGNDTTSVHEFRVGPALEEGQEGAVTTPSMEVRGVFSLEQLHNFTKAAHHLSNKVVIAVNHENYVLIQYYLDPITNLNTLRYLLSHNG